MARSPAAAAAEPGQGRRRRADRAGLVVFSPLPPMQTGIGDYAGELLPLLAAHYRCTAVVEDGVPGIIAPRGVGLKRLAEYAADAAAHAGDVHLYMLGNNPDHVFLLPTLARRPGVVVLHDPNLHHLLDYATASLGDLKAYGAAMEAEYGVAGRLLANQWRAHELRDRQMLYEMPMLRHLLGPARHVVVHSRYAAHKALAHAPDTPVTIAPHHYSPPSRGPGRAAMRARLGIGADEIVFLSLGFVSHIKRVDTALRALARIASRMPPFRYVIAGELRTDELDVMHLAETLGLSRQVITTGYVADADFFGFLECCDVVINLRHPVGGETSGTLIRALGGGACVVVVDAGPFAELPDGTAIKLPWGSSFETELADTLLRLAISPAARTQIGARAAAFIAERHSVTATITAYRAAIDAAARTPDRPWSRCGVHWFGPPQAVQDVAAPLWQRLDAVPGLSPPGAVLALGSPADIAGLRALEHDPQVADGAWDPRQEPPRSCDLLFLSLADEHALLQHSALLPACNRLLRFGGVLVLALSGIPPRRHPLAGPAAGRALLHASGFHVDAVDTAAAPDMSVRAPPEPDAIVWRATKTSEFTAETMADA